VVDELLARIRVHLTNARIAHGTRVALDATGRFLLATDSTGRLLWCTPKAKQLLTELFPSQNSHDTSLPPAVVQQLKQSRQEGFKAAGRPGIEVGNRRLQFSYLSSTGPDELLFRLTEVGTDADERMLQQALALTSREAEVLLWISRGKSNREIGEILGISPRTVNKHLEQVFVKLGVENRASAAARAVGALAR
jgi:DNA-binding CsgD family transcriptional regulator